MLGRLALALLTGVIIHAEDFKLELTAGAWNLRPSGVIQSGILPVDLKSDLALRDRWTWFGRAVIRPGERHRLLIEGTPYRFSGDNQLNRTIVYGGRTYLVREQISSHASVDYVFGGYEYSLVSRDRGHVSIGGGAAWLDAEGRVSIASDSEELVVPLGSLSARAYLNDGPVRVSVNGDVRGMTFGKYGHYVQAAVQGGVGTRHVSVLAGFGVLNLDVHDGPEGIDARFRGPLFSLQVRLP